MTKPITLVTCFYKDRDFLRHAELQECLEKNVANPLLSRVVLLVEEGAENEKLLKHPKVETVLVAKGRQTYADLIRVANERCSGEIVVLANSDIYFDETLSIFRSMDLTQTVYVSTRREVETPHQSLWSYHQQASDAWVLETPIHVDGLEIQLGKNGCESLFLGRLLRAGYAVQNISLDFKCYHMHASALRNYDPLVDRYTEESEMAFPIISGRVPTRAAPSQHQGPIVVDGVAFAERSSYAALWLEVLTEWQEMPFGRDVVVLNRGGMNGLGITLAQCDAPPLNNYLISAVRQINGTLARRLGASLFLSTGETTALGVPSVVVAHSASPEVTLANLERDEFARGLSLQMADAVLCASEDVRAVLELNYQHIGPSRFHTFPLWHGGTRVLSNMQVGERNFTRRKLGIQERYVVYGGLRVHPSRTANLRVVADALRQISSVGIIFIGGADTLEPEIKELFAGIPHRHLRVESQETLAALAAAEALVMPNLGSAESDWSHIAMASGCPVVRAEWSDLHHDGDGTVFFKACSANSLSRLLELIMYSERDRLGLEAAKRATLEARLGNGQRLALMLEAIRAKRPLPDTRAMLNDLGSSPSNHALGNVLTDFQPGGGWMGKATQERRA